MARPQCKKGLPWFKAKTRMPGPPPQQPSPAQESLAPDRHPDVTKDDKTGTSFVFRTPSLVRASSKTKSGLAGCPNTQEGPGGTTVAPGTGPAPKNKDKGRAWAREAAPLLPGDSLSPHSAGQGTLQGQGRASGAVTHSNPCNTAQGAQPGALGPVPCPCRSHRSPCSALCFNPGGVPNSRGRGLSGSHPAHGVLQVVCAPGEEVPTLCRRDPESTGASHNYPPRHRQHHSVHGSQLECTPLAAAPRFGDHPPIVPPQVSCLPTASGTVRSKNSKWGEWATGGGVTAEQNSRARWTCRTEAHVRPPGQGGPDLAETLSVLGALPGSRGARQPGRGRREAGPGCSGLCPCSRKHSLQCQLTTPECCGNRPPPLPSTGGRSAPHNHTTSWGRAAGKSYLRRGRVEKRASPPTGVGFILTGDAHASTDTHFQIPNS